MPEDVSRWDDEIRRRLDGAGLDPGAESDVTRELAQHLDDCYAELCAAGLTSEEARRRTLEEIREDAAMRRDLEATKPRTSETLVLGDLPRRGWVPGVLQDLRYVARIFSVNPGFAAVAVLTIALGIGANTAIFSVIDSMLLKPLAYDPGGRLTRVFVTEESGSAGPSPNLAHFTPSWPAFDGWRARTQALDRMAFWSNRTLTLLDSSPVESGVAVAVTAGFFDLFDRAPVAGRGFADDDAGQMVTVISHGCWQRRFGGDKGILGRAIRTLEGQYTVVGVLPADFPYLPRTDFWLPLAPSRVSVNGWGGSMVARLRSGVTEAAAQVELLRVARALGTVTSGENVAVESLHEWQVGFQRSTLLILMGAVGFILLLACANVASLLVARGAARSRELAIRAALGASRSRLVRQLLTEQLLLALLGGLAGAALARAALNALVPLLPVTVPTEMRPAVDLRVLAFTLAISCVTALVFGVFPALRLTRTASASTAAMKQCGAAAQGFGRRTGGVLVAIEIALATILLVGAGLMVRSLHNVLAVGTGFDAPHVLVVEASPVMTGEGQPGRSRHFYRELVGRIASLPSVEAVGAIDTLPFWTTAHSSVDVDGQQPRRVGVSPRRILPGYFQAMGIPMKAGRDFKWADDEHAPCVAVVNQRAAREIWPGASPVGARVRENEKGGWCEVVGVVADVRHQSLERDVLAEVYLSALQSDGLELNVIARAPHPASLVALTRARLAGLPEPTLVGRVTPFGALIDRSVELRQRRATLLSLLGGVGVLLASVGIFGTTGYAVARRTSEIGIRMALGADSRRVLRSVMGGVAPAILGGIVLGLAGSWALTRVLAQQLYQVAATDPATLAEVAAVVASVATLASYLPARRALKVDPLIALRTE
jgi:putative ABC transport system permease protein